MLFVGRINLELALQNYYKGNVKSVKFFLDRTTELVIVVKPNQRSIVSVPFCNNDISGTEFIIFILIRFSNFDQHNILS